MKALPLCMAACPILFVGVAGADRYRLADRYALLVGYLMPVQIEGLRLLLTPFPQEEFNQTEDRKSAEASRGVACLDCHANFSAYLLTL